jgi:hypothetical protein
VLLFSAVRLFFRYDDPPETKEPPRGLAVGVGAGIGFLSGLTGTGGGIFLTPLLLFCRWTYTRRAAAISVVFILVNSIAGLVGIHQQRTTGAAGCLASGDWRGDRRHHRARISAASVFPCARSRSCSRQFCLSPLTN